MSIDYLWDRSGTPDLETNQLMELLAPLAHDAPLDELRLAKGRRGERVRATAHDPVVAPPASGRVKGKMNLFDKRIIGAATLTAAALGLLGVTAYKRHVDSAEADRGEPPWRPPIIALAPSFAMTPHASPITPTTGADLAITPGESAYIHVPFGAVDVEIQSKCNAEVEMSVVTGVMNQFAHPLMVSPQTPGSGLIVGVDSPDGKTSRYHLTPRVGGLGMVQYTSRCVGQPPMHGVLAIDADDIREPIGPTTNARVFNDEVVTMATLDQGIHVFGTVMPGARVSIGATPLALEPVDPTGDDPPIDSRFTTNVPVTFDHVVAAVRVDDAKGTHFYLIHPTVLVDSCAGTTEPKQTAVNLDAQGDHAGALRTLKTAMASCKPDRDTLSLALEYACKAGDTEAARSYWHKLPPELQRTLEPVCAQNEITRDQLDAP